ncbi:hypothetical protein A3A36_01115 [Candidatus Kaiserbacteria bacterium RIFCSPLOWO2_01_FULL_52_12b]|uniref:Uncharacterized protein n=1 Tax=Candidatus Kaiserbacteria bacterium RIFCSPLOWO2_01_FULL_52_12b TaxID=1798509 RepID=A0A1F6EWW0_9BACT|nr:MAG: hypothetical protein A3A36_01115 [Candidatus Kaiserbacteria bacterium RIFCSPLOWO2_01_FULL_52_12b]
MRSVFNIAGAIVLTFAIFSPSLVFAADQFRNVGLGESFAKEWAVLACHPAKKELTLSHRYRFGKSYGLVAETVRVGVGDSVELTTPGYTSLRATLTEWVGTCRGLFSVFSPMPKS